MKRTYRIFFKVAFNALLIACLAVPAIAQQHNGGGGGGGRPAGGGGRPVGGGGGAPRQNYSPRISNAPHQGIAPGQKGVSASVKASITAAPQGRVNAGVTVRVGAAPRNGAVVVGGIGGARGYAGGFYENRGYYNSFYAPRLGFRINVLPYGYYPFYWGPYQYFYSDGLYYQYDNSQYTVVEPPVGAAINVLPENAQSIVINGTQYYELNGVYYQPITKDDGTVVYQVAGKDGELNTDGGTNTQPAAPATPQIGDIVQSLPDNSKRISIAGQQFYVSPDGYYYQDARDPNNNPVYKIVGTPADSPNQ